MTLTRTVRCLAFSTVSRGSLVGFADLLLNPHGLVLKDCPVHRRGASRWVAMPGKPVLGPDRTVVADERGKVLYSLVGVFIDPDDRRAFMAAAVRAAERFAPDAFADKPERDDVRPASLPPGEAP